MRTILGMPNFVASELAAPSGGRFPDGRPPRLAVVVPATDAPASLPRCLAALERSSEPPERLIVVAEPAGQGPAAARNRGLEECEEELVCFVDSDVEVHPDALARIRERFRTDPDLAAVFGSYDDRPADPGLVSRFRNLLHHSVHQRGAGPSGSFWAGLGAVRAGELRAVGGFDAARFPVASIEDVELGARLRAAGLRIELDPRILGTHRKRWTLGSLARTDALRRSAPWTRMLLEGRGPRSELNLAAGGRLALACTLLAATALLAGRPRSAAVALAGLAAAEAPLLALLRQRGGARLALAGLPLLLLHHLSALAGAGVGLAGHLRSRS